MALQLTLQVAQVMQVKTHVIEYNPIVKEINKVVN